MLSQWPLSFFFIMSTTRPTEASFQWHSYPSNNRRRITSGFNSFNNARFSWNFFFVDGLQFTNCDQVLPLRLHVHRLLREGDVGHGTAESGGRIPLVSVLDVHVDLDVTEAESAHIVHALRPLERGMNHRPVLSVPVNHILNLLQVRLDDRSGASKGG